MEKYVTISELIDKLKKVQQYEDDLPVYTHIIGQDWPVGINFPRIVDDGVSPRRVLI